MVADFFDGLSDCLCRMHNAIDNRPLCLLINWTIRGRKEVCSAKDGCLAFFIGTNRFVVHFTPLSKIATRMLQLWLHGLPVPV